MSTWPPATHQDVQDAITTLRSSTAARTAALFARLSNATAKPVPTTAASSPTITWHVNSYTTGLTFAEPVTPNVTLLGHGATLDTVNSKWTVDNRSGPYGMDFIHTGSKVDIGWVAGANPTSVVWIWVDGEPLTAAAVTPTVSPTTGQWVLGLLDFGSYATRRITVYITYLNAWIALGIEQSGSVSAPPARPRIAAIGDSFMGGSNGTPNQYDLPAFQAGLMLGADVLNCGVGGTGYTTSGNNYGDSNRIALAGAAGTLDALVFMGSVNDDGASGIQAAATSAFAAYATAFPNVPAVVLGTEPSNASATISTARSANIAAIKAACDASPNVIGFYDMVGTVAGVPSTFASAGPYSVGDKVTSLGSVWAWDGAAAATSVGSPGSTPYWRLVTWDYWGTGQTGTTTGVGSRDVLLYSDGVHPTTSASRVMGRRIAACVRDALQRNAAA